MVHGGRRNGYRKVRRRESEKVKPKRAMMI
jgi:hypothetical protein